MRTLALVLALAAAGCGSSAPYTLTSAAVNTGVALGAAAASRSAGGCYSPCNPGYTCNPVTGYCELGAPVCVGESRDPRCAQAAAAAVPLGTRETATRTDTALPVGVSPATGRAPPPPGDRPAPDAPR